MTALDLMHALEHLPFATTIAESTWMFPFFETLQVLALTAFRIKLACMLFAAVDMLVFHFATARDIAVWDSGRTPAAARAAGVISLSMWVVIVATGRWIGFTT